ncbi:MAG: ABC transporter, solute-binding protein [Parcubacteria group bacterium GW2011_GWA1_42_7]|nr:MAG: ABC transporter, solute-binding protein [Parcubacteria group bacterium GW2011_GWB1_42_6]KKS69749.1 MAG: ABC transporter, solute-binding protein [Parcubacteria group bacterium GW2011_GWA1_42_7]KKS92362.1 MAG: extracellular solute-binding protein, multiple sugar transport system substrate-binding protein [Parcubacteria group bacterium GW2011_GWC1_43_12]
MSLKNSKIFLASFLVIPLFFTGLFAGISPCKEKPPAPITLEFWGVFEDSDAYSSLIAQFKQVYPHIAINYYKKNIATYEQDLLNALAAGRGPDIFSIHNTWLPKYSDKLFPAPEGMLTSAEYASVFVDVASQDFVEQGKIYAFPFYVDTLALFYNKDIFNGAGIALPPATWEEVNAAAESLTKKDLDGNISQSGIALGASKNVNRCTDILSLLMIQSGAKMISDDKTSAAFAGSVYLDGENFYPASRALNFYTNFANPKKKVYSWNSSQHYSIDAFSEGKAAMMINYSYQIPALRAKAATLRFGVAGLPQISANASNAANYANYWGQGVSKGSLNANAAWQFLGWMSQKENMKTFLGQIKKPTSRRDLIEWQKADPDLGIFAIQTLSARSWRQADNIQIEKIFANMIDQALSDPSRIDEIVRQANQEVTILMQGR